MKRLVRQVQQYEERILKMACFVHSDCGEQGKAVHEEKKTDQHHPRG